MPSKIVADDIEKITDNSHEMSDHISLKNKTKECFRILSAAVVIELLSLNVYVNVS